MIWLWIGGALLQDLQVDLERLHTEHGNQAIVAVHEGWTTSQWLRDGELEELIEQTSPAVIVFVLGGEDIEDGNGSVHLEAVSRLVYLAHGASVVWVGPLYSQHANDQIRRTITRGYDRAGFVDGAVLSQGLELPKDLNVLADRMVRVTEEAIPSNVWLHLSVVLLIVLVVVFALLMASREQH